MDNRDKAKRLIDDLPEDKLAQALNFLELMQNMAGFSAEMEEFLEDFDVDHEFALDDEFALDVDDDGTEPRTHRRFSFKMVSKRQYNDGEPRVKRWEWGF